MSENDPNEEVIIEPQETNEPELEINLEEPQEPVAPKPEETLEARRARLTRQLEQTEKKMGIKPTQNTAVAGASLSPIDIIAITRANVAEDDIADVLEYAQFKKISISEALKSQTVKGILAEKDEQRTVAAATNTGVARRGSSKVSDESILEKTRKGQFPETDEGIAQLARARG